MAGRSWLCKTAVTSARTWPFRSRFELAHVAPRDLVPTPAEFVSRFARATQLRFATDRASRATRAPARQCRHRVLTAPDSDDASQKPYPETEILYVNHVYEQLYAAARSDAAAHAYPPVGEAAAGGLSRLSGIPPQRENAWMICPGAHMRSVTHV